MKRGTLLIIIGVALLAVAFGIVISILHDGLSARATPTRLEALLARNARHLAIPSNARLAQNPVLDSPEDLREARLHFADHCAICHANDGSGHSEIGDGLYPKPPDLRLAQTQNLTDGELFWIIENGVRFTGMPAFSSGTEEGEQASWHLVHFIRRLPKLTPEELKEMESLNPKSPAEIRQQIEQEEFLK